jgi:hypothetical protein
MASVVKKAVIRAADLPLVSPDNTYITRFRIISQDQNRFSHWSPIYNIPAQTIPEGGVTGSTRYVQSLRIIVIDWADGVNGPYDIFARLVDADEPFKYVATTSETFYQYYVKPPTFGNFEFVVQRASYYKDEPSPNLELYTGIQNVPNSGIA